MDNQGASPIESDGINGVARGFFIQDITYGFESIDGFVVSYNSDDNSWDTNSLIIANNDFSLSDQNFVLSDTSTYPTNYAWGC